MVRVTNRKPRHRVCCRITNSRNVKCFEPEAESLLDEIEEARILNITQSTVRTVQSERGTVVNGDMEIISTEQEVLGLAHPPGHSQGLTFHLLSASMQKRELQ
jgi:hypothetical protein